MKNKAQDMFLGMAVGSALGLNAMNSESEVTDITPFDNNKAIWSNEVSLAYCLADAISEGYDLQRIADYFLDMLDSNYWAIMQFKPDYSIDSVTYDSLRKLSEGKAAGTYDETLVSPGSLEHVLPLAFYLLDKPSSLRLILIKEVTEITHPSDLAVMANFYLMEYVLNLLKGYDPKIAYLTLQEVFPLHMKNLGYPAEELEKFWRLLYAEIWSFDSYEISPSNNVIDTLETALWAVLTSNSFVPAVLKAVNRGGNPEAQGTVTGAIAGLVFGSENIPRDWIEQIAMKDKIQQLASVFDEIFLSEAEEIL